MSSGKLLLDVRDIGRRAPSNDVWLLRYATVQVNTGDCIALTGATGSGKTVLLRSLSMLDAIDEGSILWEGSSPTRNEIPIFRSQVTYVPQRASLVDGTVEENLQLPFSLAAHRSSAYSRDTVVALLANLNRHVDFLAQDASELSGGEQQVVALVRTLQLAPQVLLLDEPTASLDATTSQQVETIIQEWVASHESRRAFIWVTHDEDQAERIATRRLKMDNGVLSEEECQQ